MGRSFMEIMVVIIKLRDVQRILTCVCLNEVTIIAA